jgi:hypothetical protein
MKFEINEKIPVLPIIGMKLPIIGKIVVNRN